MREVSVGRIKKKRAWERTSNTVYFLTSTHLDDRCVKWTWMSNCQLQKVTEMVGRIPPRPDSNIGKGLGDAVRTSDKNFSWRTLTPLGWIGARPSPITHQWPTSPKFLWLNGSETLQPGSKILWDAFLEDLRLLQQQINGQRFGMGCSTITYQCNVCGSTYFVMWKKLNKKQMFT